MFHDSYMHPKLFLGYFGHVKLEKKVCFTFSQEFFIFWWILKEHAENISILLLLQYIATWGYISFKMTWPKKFGISNFSHWYLKYALYKFENTLSSLQIPKDTFKTRKLIDFGRGENWLHHPLYKLFMKDFSYFACEGLKMACGGKIWNFEFLA